VLGKFCPRLFLQVFLKQGECFIGSGGIDAPACIIYFSLSIFTSLPSLPRLSALLVVTLSLALAALYLSFTIFNSVFMFQSVNIVILSTLIFSLLSYGLFHFLTAQSLIHRPIHQAFSFEILGEPKMTRAALSRQAIDGPCAVMQWPSGATPACCLTARRATYGPYRHPLDKPFLK